jgi:hypothetical protein
MRFRREGPGATLVAVAISLAGCTRHDPGSGTISEVIPPCSFTARRGVCPPGTDGAAVTCVDGVCRPAAALQPCDEEHPQGLCPADQLCVNSACKVPEDGELCSPVNPSGACEFGALCFDGVCYPVGDDELCSPANPQGICPTGRSCANGACIEIPPADRCSPVRPDGLCDAFEECVDGSCTPASPPDSCAPQRPGGRCPAGETCVAGVCTPADEANSCSLSNPVGLCPRDAVCLNGYCMPKVAPDSPCSVENPGGLCPDASSCANGCAQLCVEGTCRPVGSVVPCDPLHATGYCPNQELCVDGSCEPATSDNACSAAKPGGACTVGSLCLDGICYPVRDAELCSPYNPAGLCRAGEYCNGGACLTVGPGEACSPLKSDGFCDAFEMCLAAGCSTPEVPDACDPQQSAGRCPTGEICTAGVCAPLDPSTTCSLTNPAGTCPRDYHCVDGYCIAADGQDAPCGPENPSGQCPAGQGCSAGDCQQITPDNVCSMWNGYGLCPSGMVCGNFGVCEVAPGVKPCGPAHLQGPCEYGNVCEDGVCVLRLCDATTPDGACPNGLACHDGDCLFPACGPLVPFSGTCAHGYVCMDGVCRSLSGDACSPLRATGACAGAAFICDNRATSPTFGSCIGRCSPGAPTGYCSAGLLCQAGWCLESCASGVICPFSGRCCAVGEECPDATTCVPACPAPRVRCNDDQICCPTDFACRDDGVCALRCDSGTRCGVYGELCCTGTEVCSAQLECRAPCADTMEQCGDSCCAANEACIHDQCVTEGVSCGDFLDCEYNQYCEPTIARCLPADVPGGDVCQLPRPPEIFNPTVEWRWTGLWPACRPSFDCRGGECATLCETNAACRAGCVGHRCQCQSATDCASGTEHCRDGVCVIAGSTCGALFENVLSMPTVADLQHDGLPEVVFRAYAGDDLAHAALVALNGKDGGDGSGAGSPPEMFLDGSLPGIPWLYASGHQALGNLDDDPELEIVAVAATGLVAFDDPVNGNGAVLWSTTTYPLNRTLDGGAPLLVDLNGDGKAEVVMGAVVLQGRTGAILAVPAGGAALEGGGSRFDGGWISTVADLDLDDKPELITGNRAYDVEESLGAWSLTPLWQSVTGVLRPPGYSTTVNVPHGFSAIANFVPSASGFDTPEVVNVAGGNLYLFDGLSGALLVGPIPVPAGAAGVNHGGPPTIADFDGDGRPEVAAAGSGCYTVYDFDCLAGYSATSRADVASLPGCALPPNDRCGSYPSMVGVLWNYKVQDFSSAVTGSSVFDFDGNGADEVLYNDECFFRVFDGKSGTVLMERPNSSRTNSEYPIVADVDGDRMSEIVLVANHDQIGRDHCISNFDNDAAYAPYRHYSDITATSAYCDLATFPAHTRECTVGAAGVTVYRDTSEQWVKTRPLWPQHTYHVTDVELDPQTFVASVPAHETPSWMDSNTYRKNVRGFVPLNAADLRVTSIVADLQQCPTVVINARVANLGALGVAAGVAVSLYALWETPPRFVAFSSTTGALLPGAAEWLTFRYTPNTGDPTTLSFRVEADGGTGAGSVAECVETNNGAELDDITCADKAPVARCLVFSPPLAEIGPLSTVTLDGGYSYSPRAPNDATSIAAYSWDVVTYPDGAWPGDFAPQGNGTARYSIWLPIAGTYTVQLRVSDEAGAVSADAPDSYCTIDVVPKSFVHVQLVWNNGVNDQDLHVVWWDRPGGDRKLFREDDCYYANPLPSWFGSFTNNPRLDIDDTYGYGPENFNIDRPVPGTYRVYVNYAGNHYNVYDTPPTVETVRIYLKGVLAGEFRRELLYNGSTYEVSDIWAIADIEWRSDSDYVVKPLPSDEPAIGLVGYLCSIIYDGFSGWWDSNCPTNP